MSEDEPMEMIVTIVKKGWGDTVLNASRMAGAEGGTIMFGRGSGVHEKKSLFGSLIEPEKEIVLTIVPAKLTNSVLRAIIKETELDSPGNGIAVVLPLNAMVGCVHLEGECKIKKSDE